MAVADQRQSPLGGLIPTGEIGANERMRHVAEGRFLILRELDLREARHKRRVNECANSRTRAAAPLLVIY